MLRWSIRLNKCLKIKRISNHSSLLRDCEIKVNLYLWWYRMLMTFFSLLILILLLSIIFSFWFNLYFSIQQILFFLFFLRAIRLSFLFLLFTFTDTISTFLHLFLFGNYLWSHYFFLIFFLFHHLNFNRFIPFFFR